MIMNINKSNIRNWVYNTIKDVMVAVGAIIVAELLGLNFSLSAGIIAILSLLDSRKETIQLGVRRIITGVISLAVAVLLFEILGYNLLALGIFILLVSFFSYATNSAFSIASSLVLASHIYSIKNFTVGIYLNEVYILLIGVAMGFLLTLHMPNDEKHLKEGIKYIEEQYKNHLIVMAHNLKNHCVVRHNTHSVFDIEKRIKRCRKISKRYKNNKLFGNSMDYRAYFDMRLEQVYRLMHMKEKMELLFISHHEADKLSEFTEIVSNRFSANSPVDDLLELTDEYYEYFRKRPLPKTREQFECRATLFQYLVEMEEFIRIKARYLESIND